jgi:hypothetical protein
MNWLRRGSHSVSREQPTGTGDRPALPASELDRRAWQVLCWRRERLPLDRLRRRSDGHALVCLEWRATSKIADQLRLDHDQLYSLWSHHLAEVERLAVLAAPIVFETSHQYLRRIRLESSLPKSPFEIWWQRTMPSRWRGWPTWLEGRRVDFRDLHFRMVTRRYYRSTPKLIG